jgi:uncharacterized protein YhaN
VNVDLYNDIDRLYGVPRDEFIRERDTLARSLRTSGDKGTAAEVAALRKPTLVAWTVNQLAYTRRRDIDLLLDAGQRIIDAQKASISSGGRSELDAAQASLRQAVNALTEAAGAILGPNASRTTLTRVAETLRTGATAPAGRELLARGQLTEELSGTGWEIVAGFEPGPRAKPKRGGAAAAGSAKATPTSRGTELKAEQKRLAELKKTYAAAAKEQRDARREERAAAAQLESLHDARLEADAKLEAIEKDIAGVEQRVADLRDGSN